MRLKPTRSFRGRLGVKNRENYSLVCNLILIVLLVGCAAVWIFETMKFLIQSLTQNFFPLGGWGY